MPKTRETKQQAVPARVWEWAVCLTELVPMRIFHGWRFRTRFAQGEEAPGSDAPSLAEMQS